MSLKRILFGIISFSFLFTHLIFQLNAGEMNLKEKAKKLTVESAKKTSTLMNDFANYLEGNKIDLTPEQSEQAEKIITSPEAQKTITIMNAFGQNFEEFTQGHPHFYLAAKGFVGVALIGTTLYLVYKTGALHKAKAILGFIKKNPEITTMTLLSLLGTGLYAAKELYPESSASSLYSNLGGWQGMFGITVFVGAGIKFCRWFTSNSQETPQTQLFLTDKSENNEESKEEKQEESSESIHSLKLKDSSEAENINENNSLNSSSISQESYTSATVNSITSSSSINLKQKKEQILTNLALILANKSSLTENELLEQVKDFNDDQLNGLVKAFFKELNELINKGKTYGNAASKKIAIENYLKQIKKFK